jgi:hypothetical protein
LHGEHLADELGHAADPLRRRCGHPEIEVGLLHLVEALRDAATPRPAPLGGTSRSLAIGAHRLTF